jgi:three-Cys-motif partner protein
MSAIEQPSRSAAPDPMSVVPQHAGSPSAGSSDGHWYGGPWTEIKLDAVMYFVGCYTKALTPAGFDLWYVDAFAGSGDRKSTRRAGGILEGVPLQLVTETLDGSARRALAIEPPFRHFIFNEKDATRNRALQRLATENPLRDIQIRDGEANQVLKEVFESRLWAPKAAGKARGLVFLDPYALQVEWQTLLMLARTQAVDVWYLFPLRDVTRQLAHRRSGIGPKEARLDRVLGPKWRELYSLPEPASTWRQTSLFGESSEVEEERNSSQKQIEDWFQGQLNDIFAHVSDPLPLLTGGSRQAFSLFLCVANPSSNAIRLAKHFHSYVIKHFAPGASHRMSGLGVPSR